MAVGLLVTLGGAASMVVTGGVMSGTVTAELSSDVSGVFEPVRVWVATMCWSSGCVLVKVTVQVPPPSAVPVPMRAPSSPSRLAERLAKTRIVAPATDVPVTEVVVGVPMAGA